MSEFKEHAPGTFCDCGMALPAPWVSRVFGLHQAQGHESDPE